MTTAGQYLAAITQLRAEITEVSINHQTVAQRDNLDDLSTRRYKFADGSVLTEAIDPDCHDVYYEVGA
jgi:hypothetical protein